MLFIAVVARLLVLVAIAAAIAVVDLRHDGFKIKSGRVVGGRAQRLPPKAWRGSRCSTPLSLFLSWLL